MGKKVVSKSDYTKSTGRATPKTPPGGFKGGRARYGNGGKTK